MFFFILRRMLVSIPILLASTFLVFGLTTMAGDPLTDLRQSQSPNKEVQIAAMRDRLDLDKSVPERYVKWLKGVPKLEFGKTRDGQEVWPILKQAMITTLRLVVLAVLLSVAIGLAVGILSAVRQYSLFDYGATFAAFLCFSLPVFWLAVLLKEFGAIKFNNFLTHPGLSTTGIILLSVIGGLFFWGAVGGTWKRRAIGGGVAFVASLVIFWLIDKQEWVRNPGFSRPMIALLAALGAVLGTAMFATPGNRRVLVPALVAAAGGVLSTYFLGDWLFKPDWTRLVLMAVMATVFGTVVGLAMGGIDRAAAAKAGAFTALFTGGVILFDEFISAWKPGRTIATVGPQTPNLKGTFWPRMIDYAGHQILPSLALALIGFAGYSRFTRASMLETLNSDYVRTAKAKGLAPTQVVMRHAFRTALIPVTTLITLSFGSIIEGAVITERVFAWKGMGSLFVKGLYDVDPYPVMGFLLIVSLAIIFFNAIADILYAYLDPRIRVV